MRNIFRFFLYFSRDLLGCLSLSFARTVASSAAVLPVCYSACPCSACRSSCHLAEVFPPSVRFLAFVSGSRSGFHESFFGYSMVAERGKRFVV